MTEKDKKHISKFISLVLRHQPQLAGLTPDENGWVEVAALINGAARKQVYFNVEQLEDIVATNDKQRFSFDNDKRRIRASQGHSIEVELQLAPQQPPDLLYHGTVEKFMDSIKEKGLQKMSRHHVHLSSSIATATQVGSRRGKPVILTIQAAQMEADGYSFFKSENDVWLTDVVPPQYIAV